MFEHANLAFSGDFEALKKCGSWTDPFVVRAAAAGGHLNCLEWALRHGAPWDERASIVAATKGHIHVLKWIVDNGFPLHRHTAFFAPEGVCKTFAMANGCELSFF